LINAEKTASADDEEGDAIVARRLETCDNGQRNKKRVTNVTL
jgi:hypothetical protein